MAGKLYMWAKKSQPGERRGRMADQIYVQNFALRTLFSGSALWLSFDIAYKVTRGVDRFGERGFVNHFMIFKETKFTRPINQNLTTT